MDFFYVKAVKELVGNNYEIIELIEKEEIVFIFFDTKDRINNHYDDRYPSLIGSGPIVHFKKSNEIKLLGITEYYDIYAPQYLKEELDKEWELPSINEVVNTIKKRKHINGKDFESILEILNIDEDCVKMVSYDDDDIVDGVGFIIANLIKIEAPKVILDQFTSKFLDRISFPYTRKSNNQLEFYNSILP